MDRLLILLILSVMIEAHVHKSTGSRHTNSIKTSKTVGSKINESQLVNIHPSLPNLNAEKARKTSAKNDDENIDARAIKDDDVKPHKEEVVFQAGNTGLQSSEDKGYNRSDSEEAKRQKFVDYLITIWNENNENKASDKPNRRLDINDDRDDVLNVVDTDNQNAKEDQKGPADMIPNKRLLSYGSLLEMKGRTGEGGLPTNNNMMSDRLFYRPSMRGPTMRGLFYNHGRYPFANIPQMTFTKINNRDIIQPYSNVPFSGNSRRLQVKPDDEETPDLINVDDSPDPDANAYPYEPEEFLNK